MDGIELVAIMILVGFLGGIMTGLILIVSVASRREDRRYSLTTETADTICAAARRLIGVSVRGNAQPNRRW